MPNGNPHAAAAQQAREAGGRRDAAIVDDVELATTVKDGFTSN